SPKFSSRTGRRPGNLTSSVKSRIVTNQRSMGGSFELPARTAACFTGPGRPTNKTLIRPTCLRRNLCRDANLPARKIYLGGGGCCVPAVPPPTADGQPYLVEVGAPTTPIDTMLDRLLLLLVVGLPVVVLVAVGGGYFLVKRALTPVDRIGSKAELIT